MDTKALRCFWRVYEERSVNKAAKQLFITPQGLSKAIHALEEELDAPLFERSAQGMAPTAAGDFLYQRCRELLDKFNEIQIGLRRLREDGRKLKFACACGVLNVFPPRQVEALRENLQGLDLQYDECVNEEVASHVQSGEYDLGLVTGPVTGTGLVARELFSKKLDAIVYEGHRFYGRASLSVRDLAGESLITLNERFSCYHGLVARCADFGFTPTIAIKTMESQLIYRFCRQGLGLGIDVDIHDGALLSPGLRSVELIDSIPWKISLVARRDRLGEAKIQAALQAIK